MNDEEKQDMKFFKDESTREVVCEKFEINELSSRAMSLLTGYFVFQMKKLGYLATIIDKMSNDGGVGEATGRLFLKKELPLETIDSWVELQLQRNRVIFLER